MQRIANADRGAARSKKRQQQLEKEAQARQLAASRAKPSSSSAEAGPSTRPPRPARPLPQKKERPVREEQSRDPELYKAKAVRSNAALDWNAGPFELPPASLEGITRVDLTGSGVTDVSWLRGSSVRWLGVSGCKIEDWSAVGSLTELTVLNINDCGLTALPEALKSLTKLKALVAMNNPWATISSEVLASWPELNSLIISHSPNLTAIPRLSTLIHLSKITFSHCPRITPASIPSMSDLPVLRDVKMNNLPLLTTLPRSLQYWGTGPMSSLNPTDERKGQGIEVLDVGSCSLGEGTLDMLKKADFPILRSLTLHHNPLDVARPKYAEELQGLRNLPKLAIIDNKRVVERVKKEGGEKKSKKKGREVKGKPSGANTGGKGQMREWGSKRADGETLAGAAERGEVAARAKPGLETRESDKKEKKRKRSGDAEESTPVAEKKRSKKDDAERTKKPSEHTGEHEKRTKAKSDPVATKDRSSASQAKTADASPATVVAKVADPSVLTAASTKKHSKNETGVYGVVDVVGEAGSDKTKTKASKKHRDAGKEQSLPTAGAAKHTGIDLKSLVAEKGDNGLGVDSW